MSFETTFFFFNTAPPPRLLFDFCKTKKVVFIEKKKCYRKNDSHYKLSAAPIVHLVVRLATSQRAQTSREGVVIRFIAA